MNVAYAAKNRTITGNLIITNPAISKLHSVPLCAHRNVCKPGDRPYQSRSRRYTSGPTKSFRANRNLNNNTTAPP